MEEEEELSFLVPLSQFPLTPFCLPIPHLPYHQEFRKRMQVKDAIESISKYL
jgi:hypothetical protein